MTTKLNVTARTQDAASVRAAGKVPGIVYGPKQDPINIEVETLTFTKLMNEAGESTIISLEGLDEAIEVLIHDVAFDAAKGGVSHVDFYAIERGKDLTTDVPLEFIGEAPAEKSGAMVVKALQSVTVTCRPSALPSQIEVDLTVLVDESSSITVADLTVSSDVTIDTDPEMAVASVAAARAEEPTETEAEAVDMDAIEVEPKGGEGEEDAPAA